MISISETLNDDLKATLLSTADLVKLLKELQDAKLSSAYPELIQNLKDETIPRMLDEYEQEIPESVMKTMDKIDTFLDKLSEDIGKLCDVMFNLELNTPDLSSASVLKERLDWAALGVDK